MMINPHMRWRILFLVLVVMSLACSIPVAGVEPPASPVPLSTQEFQQLKEQVEATFANPATNEEVTVTITEQQLQSFIISSLSEQDEQVITEPQVDLTNGQALVYGKVQQSGITANTLVILEPRLDANGTPKLEVVSIKIGPFPVPDSLKSRVQAITDNALNQYLASGENRFDITDIAVVEDEVRITGLPQQP